jgi:hypothetical protein
MIENLGGEGFTPVIPPVLVRERALYGTGFLPDTEQQIYRLEEDDLYLTGTSEVALASLHDGDILDEGDLPLRYAGISPCFRREAGAAGKDTRGIFRVHQFEKVEMFVFCDPAKSSEEHERILSIEESADPLPRREYCGRRSGVVCGEEVRHRGVAAEPAAVSRTHFLFKHHRLPGKKTGYSGTVSRDRQIERHSHP